MQGQDTIIAMHVTNLTTFTSVTLAYETAYYTPDQ